MGYVEDWNELLLGLQCFSKASAKRKFKQQIRYSWGGMCAYCREQRATTVDHIKPKNTDGKDVYTNLQLLHGHCHDTKTLEDVKKAKNGKLYGEINTYNPKDKLGSQDRKNIDDIEAIFNEKTDVPF